VLKQISSILIICFGGDKQIEIDQDQEGSLQFVDFSIGDPANCCIVRIAVISIISCLRSEKDTGDQQAMDVVRCDVAVLVRGNQTIKVNEGEDETLRAAVRILDYAIEIITGAYRRDFQRVEDFKSVRGAGDLLISLGYVVENGSDDRDERSEILLFRSYIPPDTWGECTPMVWVSHAFAFRIEERLLLG